MLYGLLILFVHSLSVLIGQTERLPGLRLIFNQSLPLILSLARLPLLIPSLIYLMAHSPPGNVLLCAPFGYLPNLFLHPLRNFHLPSSLSFLRMEM